MFKCADSSCEYFSEKEFKFCSKCGTKQKLTCVECGAAVTTSMKFCSNCGTKIDSLKASGRNFDVDTTGAVDAVVDDVYAKGASADTVDKFDNVKIKVVGVRGGRAKNVIAAGLEAGSAAGGRKGAAAELAVWNESYSFPGTVDPCEPDWDARRSKPVYNMNTEPKGWFFLVNNFNFEEARKRNPSCKDRHGTQTDAKALTELFKQFGFQVEQRDDLTAEAMQKALKEQVQRCAKNPYSCFCAAILSHGKDGGVVGTDGEFLSTKEIMDMFDGDKCPKLIGKPKVFFIQACQGENKDKGCEVPDGWTINDALLDEMAEVKNQTDGPGEKISGYADFFLAVATVSGYVSWRHVEKGSYFISALVKIFRTQACKCDLLSLMTKVNNELVLSRQQKDYVQVARCGGTLTKDLYFTPGLPSTQRFPWSNFPCDVL